MTWSGENTPTRFQESLYGLGSPVDGYINDHPVVEDPEDQYSEFTVVYPEGEGWIQIDPRPEALASAGQADSENTTVNLHGVWGETLGQAIAETAAEVRGAGYGSEASVSANALLAQLRSRRSVEEHTTSVDKKA